VTAASVIVLTTFPVDGDVRSFARTLVEERIAACVNVLPPMQSTYRWQGKVEEASEHQVIIKTTTEAVERLKARVTSLHPYDVPEILIVPISGGGARYLEWLQESVE
jgi:periplasmic divalent cation tolerance protein